jgi:hypothetical protein
MSKASSLKNRRGDLVGDKYMPLKRIAYNIFFNSCDGGLVLDYKILFFKSCNASNSREGDLCKIQDAPFKYFLH